MKDALGTGHPAKEQLRVLLHASAARFGFTDAAIGELVRRARIERPADVLCSSGDRDDLVNMVVSGAIRIEIVHSARCRRILKFMGAGEMFCLTPNGTGGWYRLEGRVHEHAIVAVWTRDSVAAVLAMLPPANVMRLVTTSWLHLSRVAEARCLLSMLPVDRRITMFLERLARRHGVRCPEGTLIDLRLRDHDIGQLVGATRSTVNRRMNAARRKGLLLRAGDRVVLVGRRG